MKDQAATRLETLGRLTSGVAHEINTPIQYISDNTAFLRDAFAQLLAVIDSERLKDEELRFVVDEVPQAVEETLRGIDHVARIVRALRQFGHDSPEPVASDAHELAGYALMLSRNQWKRIVRAELEPATELPRISVCPGELVQSLLNLIVNAAHAVEDRFGGESLRQGRVRVAVAQVDDGIRVAVSDNGCGIPDELREKIFEPFFTTKGEGRGTGQGLAILHEFCQRHGWELDVRSVRDEGTTVALTLPLEGRPRP